jgi:hypothetical protein
MSTAPTPTSASGDQTGKSTADAGPTGDARGTRRFAGAKFTPKRPILALIVGMAVIGLAVAGCGGSANHTSAWTNADVQKLKSELQGQENITPALIACVVPAVEARTSPNASSAEGEKAGREAAVGCEKSVNHVTVSSNGESASSSEKQFGPACQKQLESAACAEEQEQKLGKAAAEGEAKVAEEQKKDQQEYEQQNGNTPTEEP